MTRLRTAFLHAAWVTALAGSCRPRAVVVRDAAVGPERPVVTCLPLRECGCVIGCGGTSIPSAEHRVGLVVPIVAGDGCGRSARIERAVSSDGTIALILGTTGECEHRCGMTAAQPVNLAACEGTCGPCGR